MKIAPVLWVSLIIIALICPSSHGKLLVGEIQHAERLSPVEPSLSPGAVYDPRNLPGQAPNSIRFFRIPQWLAGTWHKDWQTDYYRYNFVTKQTDITTRTETARSDGTWGTQADKDGNVWQYDGTPFQTTVDSGSEYVVELVRSSEPVESSGAYFIRRSVDTQIRVDKATNQIKSVESGEQLTTYLPEQDGLVKRETSAKVFDQSGQPVLLGKSFCYETRIRTFAPQDTFQGKDMKSLFAEFMKRQAETAFLQDNSRGGNEID
jgi:hypothetical protein